MPDSKHIIDGWLSRKAAANKSFERGPFQLLP
jgi:hypothetical protein